LHGCPVTNAEELLKADERLFNFLYLFEYSSYYFDALNFLMTNLLLLNMCSLCFPIYSSVLSFINYLCLLMNVIHQIFIKLSHFENSWDFHFLETQIFWFNYCLQLISLISNNYYSTNRINHFYEHFFIQYSY
jgi:hypothetical protein